MLVSVVLRTYNEEKHLDELLSGINSQEIENVSIEVIIVDSGSTDNTLSIAKKYNCKIFHILAEEFTFGRSLNKGCRETEGDYLIFISGHCIPVEKNWLKKLIQPLIDGAAVYSYGKQVGNGDSKFSECQLFRKHYPNTSSIPQLGYFCNNANAAIVKNVWQLNHFDEELSGLEDMELARRLQHNGMSIAYVSEAAVYHIHEESWLNIRNRYEREAYALQHIMPEVHVSFLDFIRYFISAVFYDFGKAIQNKHFMRVFVEIIMFRLMQFWGSYKGNHEHRKLSKKNQRTILFSKMITTKKLFLIK